MPNDNYHTHRAPHVYYHTMPAGSHGMSMLWLLLAVITLTAAGSAIRWRTVLARR